MNFGSKSATAASGSTGSPQSFRRSASGRFRNFSSAGVFENCGHNAGSPMTLASAVRAMYSLSAGTVKNRLAHLRWWAEKVGKTGLIPADNAQLAVPDRLVTNENKGRELGNRLERVCDPYVRTSLLLQEAFGLRREEAIKFPSELCGPRRSDRSEGFVDEGRPAPSHTDHDTRAARCTRSCAPDCGSGIAHPGAQNVHPAAAHLRRTVQGCRSQPYARTATPLRASTI